MPSPTISARIPEALNTRLHTAANELGISPSEFLTRAIHSYLDQLQTGVDKPKDPAPDITQLESRIAALESIVFAPADSKPKRVASAAKPDVLAPAYNPLDPVPEGWQSWPVAELRKLARQVIGPGAEKDPATRRPLTKSELVELISKHLQTPK